MSTDNKTTGSNSTSFNFNGASLQAYLKNLGSFLPLAQSWMNNPYGNQTFQQESSANQDQAAKMGQRGVSNVTNNAAAMGYGTKGPAFNSMLNAAGRATNTLQAQGFRGAVGNANQRMQLGMQVSSAFQPLMTGTNSNFSQTQSTSGLGTWLPPVAGMALGAATAGAGGGFSAKSAFQPSGGSQPGTNWSNGVIGGLPGQNGVPGGNAFGSGMPGMFGMGSGMPPVFGGNGAYGR